MKCDRSKSIAFASAVIVDAVSGNRILDIIVFGGLQKPSLQPYFEPSVLICIIVAIHYSTFNQFVFSAEFSKLLRKIVK